MRGEVHPRRVARGGGAVVAARRAVEIAERQRGVVTREQLRLAGLGPGAIDHRLRSGQLRTIHRGVYLMGPVRAAGATELAATLACGPDAYVSHASAARLYRLPARAHADRVHVTVVGRAVRPRVGIRTHRVTSVHPSEIGVLEGIPITSPARTLLDLAWDCEPDELERLVAEAYARRLCSAADVRRIADRHPRRPGAPALRSLLDDAPPAFTRSEAERRFLRLVRGARLPTPLVNHRVLGYEVDFVWPRERVVAEVDGHAFHASRPQRERDARRDQDLVAAGYAVLRITWRQLAAEPHSVIARLAAALVARRRATAKSASPSPRRSGARPRPS